MAKIKRLGCETGRYNRSRWQQQWSRIDDVVQDQHQQSRGQEELLKEDLKVFDDKTEEAKLNEDETTLAARDIVWAWKFHLQYLADFPH